MHTMILIVIACLQAVSAFTCPEDSRTFYYADVSTGCQVYHLCQNSQSQTFSCPHGQAFSHMSSHCEDASTVNCIFETIVDHAHHHKRSAEDKIDLREHKPVFTNKTENVVQDMRVSNTTREYFPKQEKRISAVFLAGVLSLIQTYCKTYQTCNSTTIPSVSFTEFFYEKFNVTNPIPTFVIRQNWIIQIWKKFGNSKQLLNDEK